jgi:cobalt/nickel transport system permease protein
MLLHVGAFHLDINSKQSTLWHSLAPRTRLLCTLLLVFASALTPNGRWLTWAVYAVGVLGVILLSRVTLLVLLRRIAVEFAFIGVVILGTLFRDGGTVLWSWGPLKITTVGLTILGSVAIKALISLLILNVLTLTTSIPALLNALVALRMPPLLVATIAGNVSRGLAPPTLVVMTRVGREKARGEHDESDLCRLVARTAGARDGGGAAGRDGRQSRARGATTR